MTEEEQRARQYLLDQQTILQRRQAMALRLMASPANLAALKRRWDPLRLALIEQRGGAGGGAQ